MDQDHWGGVEGFEESIFKVFEIHGISAFSNERNDFSRYMINANSCNEEYEDVNLIIFILWVLEAASSKLHSSISIRSTSHSKSYWRRVLLDTVHIYLLIHVSYLYSNWETMIHNN